MYCKFIYLYKRIVFIGFLFCGHLQGFNSGVLCAQTPVNHLGKENSVHKIKTYFQEGKYDEGKELAQRELQKSPEDSDLRMLLGKFYVHTQHYDKARFELNKAIQFDPTSMDARYLLITVETETKRYSSAICYINELLEFNPYSKDLWRKKIELFRLQGNEIEANRLLKRINQVFPNDSIVEKDYHYAMEVEANAKRKEGRMDEAIEITKLLSQEKPRDIALYIQLIDDYIKNGDYVNGNIVAERGLHRFPDHLELRQKKIALLEQEKRYDEILDLLKQEKKSSQYAYFLVEAARFAREKESSVLYGKILESNPGNEEAFQAVYNDLIAKQQYSEALLKIKEFKQVRGVSKKILSQELELYRLRGDQAKYDQLAKNIFFSFQDDSEAKAIYIEVMSKEIKTHISQAEWNQAEYKLKLIAPYASSDYSEFITNGLLNSYDQQGKYVEALQLLDQVLQEDPLNKVFILKQSDVLMKVKQYDKAVEVYEGLLANTNDAEYLYYSAGLQEQLLTIVKDCIERERYTEAFNWVKRWLNVDGNNQKALLYAINLAHQTKNQSAMLYYAQYASEVYPEESLFKIKLAAAMQDNEGSIAEIWTLLRTEVERNPYGETIINAYVQATYDYGKHLLKNREEQRALEITIEGLQYKPTDETLNYLKGLVHEKLKQYDLAFYHQSFYQPGLMEVGEFKRNLKYLENRTLNNQLSINHMRSRYGDDYTIKTVSMLEYIRKQKKNTYAGRLFYSGQEEGRGIQGQVEWTSEWNKNWTTRFDLACADQYFAKIATQGAIKRAWTRGWATELAVGYRQLYTNEELYALAVTVEKELGLFHIQSTFTQSLLERKWLYNGSIQVRYHLEHSKNYLQAMANVGSTPDVEMLNYQNFNSLSLLNSMVGAGVGRLVTKNMSIHVLGTWYNFKTDSPSNTYRNLYNLFLQVDVAF